MDVAVGTAGLLAFYVAIGTAALLAGWLRRRLSLAALRRQPARRPGARAPIRLREATASAGKLVPALVLCAALAGLAASQVAGDGTAGPGPPGAGLRVSVLDVGQGDAILLQPAAAPAVLVDGGPPGQGLAAKLDAAGVTRLGAAVVTHDQSDHAGGIVELLGAIPIDRFLYAVLDRPTVGAAQADGAMPRRIAAGTEIRSGPLRLEVLWPPPELLAGSHRGEDPNRLALVMLLRWRDFSMLLGADAEAEATPLDPGPLDVLKIAHHGSEDAGLADLLDRTLPELAVISAGEDNPFGHPAPATLAALAARGTRVLRTDRDGTIAIEVRRGSFQALSGP